ncbi:hypothetical protein DM860_008625 [Cuscuta australis]|uniref:Uncharacterized protein n=1 Tax=Cuscuta australis TaxID=267555 RepID=A0A328D558_9ASTE|nr:hypothetical protein DM860_008625 [Cuscuta australis]
MAGSDWADEWQLVNDDGFIYKRPKKRPRLDPQTPSSSSSPASSSSSHPLRHDYAAEEKKILRERKRAALLNLKNKYQTEIRMWEQLSNTLNATCEKASAHQQIQQGDPVSSSDLVAGTSEPPADNSSRRIIDDLLSKAEIQGAMIADISKLCDDAEVLCMFQEERLKKRFLDLPIWEKSPHRLISSLSQD